MRVKLHITLKDGVLDPQGRAVGRSLHSMGFQNVQEVRQGKYIELDLNETSVVQAKKHVTEMCKQLLANLVIENYSIEIDGE
ncbi:MAG: phosphoribosylformylglycinamidine synthase [Rhodospirillaceae bacterium]|nr:phosphoribosylformylglycinamidine synthase [Rhodospirillaceae bacterium]OUT76118.1 MAG: phosphoribosylformylglycinamidine synthase [Rhodospirillaceae bacterium TMED23]